MSDRLHQPPEGNVSRTHAENRTGVVTLVFTDVVGSTALMQRLGDRAGFELVDEHHALVRRLLAEFPGAEEIATAGDSFLLTFQTPSEAVRFSLLMQLRMEEFNRGRPLPVLDRIGLHMGEVLFRRTLSGGWNVHGIQVDTCSRVMSLAQGGQILMTRPVFDNARQTLKGEEVEGGGPLAFLNHGLFELKGVEEPVEICEVRAAHVMRLPPPTTSEKARPVSGDGETVLGWRPAVGQCVPNSRWFLEEKLGEGGFGEVWRAWHEGLRERRVFKFSFRADRVRSLKREATLFRLLKERVGEHENLVKLFDLNLDHPPFFLEEEFVPGKDLRNWCEAQGGVEAIPLDTRIDMIAQAADALQAAHEAGIIHRDVKPGNILIAQTSPVHRPIVKLTDFGIGQVVSAELLSGVASTGFTQTVLEGGISGRSGTQLYLAPELLSGHAASTRSDVYSLGVVLYQLLVGDFRKPVTTDWGQDIADPLLREDLALCFAGKPGERFAAAGLLAKNLRSLPERRAKREKERLERVALERAAYRQGVVRTAALATVVCGIIAVLAWQLRSTTIATQRQARQVGYATVRLVVANGVNPAEQGDWMSAGLWFSEAFLLDGSFQNPADAQANSQTHRLRINSLLERYPPLEQMWFGGAEFLGGFAPDASGLLLGDTNGFRLRSLQTGGPTSPAVGRGDAQGCLHPDGNRVVTGNSSNLTVTVWEVASGRRLLMMQFPGSQDPSQRELADVQYSADGRWIAAVSSDPAGIAVIWDATTGQTRRELRYEQIPKAGEKSHSLRSVRFDATGQRLVTTGFDGLAVVWDWQTDRAPNVLKVHDSYVYRACFARHHTNWLVTCSFDRKARIWDLRTGRWIVEVEHEGDAVIDAQLSPDDRVLVTGGLDASVRLWSAETGRLVPPLMRSHERVKQVCWSADGRHLAAITWGGVGRVWRFEQYRREQPTTDEWSPDGNYSLSRGPGTLTFKDTAKGVATHLTNAALSESPVRFAGGPERFLSFVPRAGQAGATNSGGSVLKGAQVRLWESATGKAIGKPLELANSFRMVSAPQGRRFAFLQAAVLEGNQEAIHEILVWDPSNENPERRLTFSDEGIESLAFDPNGQRLAVGSHSLSGGERVLRLIDLKGDAEPEALYRSSQNIVQIAFSKDGRWLAAACATPALDPGEALVWRIPRAGGRFTEPNHLRHPDGVLDVAFSDSCQALATASEDQTALVWRLSRGDWKPALRPLRCSGKVLLSAFSHHERWLATASRTPRAQQSGTRDCQVRIWDAANNEPVSLPWEFSRLVTGLIFLDNDKALLVECWEPPQEPVRWLIPLPTGSGDPGELLVKAQLLSAQKSFLSGGSHLFEHTRDGLLSAEEALSYAMSVAPVRPLTTHECEQLWLLMPRSKPRF